MNIDNIPNFTFKNYNLNTKKVNISHYLRTEDERFDIYKLYYKDNLKNCQKSIFKTQMIIDNVF